MIKPDLVQRPWLLLTSSASLASLAHLMLETSSNFLPVVFPVLIEKLNMSYLQVGTVALIGSLCGTLAQPIFGWLSDRWDARLVVTLSLAWIGAFMGWVGFAASYPVLLLVVGLGALGSAAYHPAGAAVAYQVTAARRGVAMSAFSVAGNLGSAISPLLVGAAVARLGTRGTTILWPMMALASLVLFLGFRWNDRGATGRAAPEPTTRNHTGSRLIIGLIIVFVAARSWFQGALMTYLPEWLQQGGSSLESAGFLLSVLLFSTGAGSMAGGTLSDRAGRLPVVVVSLSLLVPAHWLMIHSAGLLQILALSGIGLLIGATFPVAILMAQTAWPRRVGLASSLVMGLGWLPAGFGSWFVGWMADQRGLNAALGTLVFVPLIGVLAALLIGVFSRAHARRIHTP